MRNHLLIIAAVFLATATPLAAQEAPAETVEDIVVTARRIEGPMWEVRRGDSVLILVGAIDGLPRDMEWRTDALVSAVERADRVLFPVEGRASLADLGRVIWRVRTLTRLPDDRTSADYLSPALEARLERVTGQGPSRQSFLMLSSDLMEQGGYARRARRCVVCTAGHLRHPVDFKRHGSAQPRHLDQVARHRCSVAARRDL